jgi:hypothetical protein
MLAFLGMIPIIGQIVTGITTAFFNAKVSLVQARIGGDRDVAVKLVQAAAQESHENTSRLSIIAGNRLLTFLIVAFAFPLVIFEFKVVVIDIVIGPGSFLGFHWVGDTDPIRGQVADWATTIIGFIFGSATVTTVGRMWFGRNKDGE